jgi:hypothetical protein
MWIADIYFDLKWAAERQGILGPPRFTLTGGHSRSLGIQFEQLLYGDEKTVRHLRVLMHTDARQTADTFIDQNANLLVTSLEVAMMMETQKPFHVEIGLANLFAVALFEGNENSHAAWMNLSAPQPNIDYTRVALGLAAWGNEFKHYLFYFRRFIDISLPLDVRWLNGYRLLEWRFVASNARLARSNIWQAFMSRFEASLCPFARPSQTLWGMFEETRALAAHAGIDERTDQERAIDPRNLIEKTFRVLEDMVITAINEHPGRTNSPIRLERPRQ